MKKDRMKLPAVPGASSLLVALAVLALTVFAVFSVSMVSAEEKLADTAVSAITGYYEAECEAERILAEIRSGRLPEGVTIKDGICSYSCFVSERKTLHVSVAVEGTEYHILRWQVVPDAEWEYDGHISVWDGEVILEEEDWKGEGIWPL